MSKTGIGFIGCGGIHNAHAPHVVEHEDAFIACAMDVSEDAAKAHCEKYGTENWTMDVDELLGRDDVDAVFICTPTGFHAGYAAKAAAAGKHMFCEKPMAMTVADCESMAAAADEAGVIIQLGFVRHYCNEWMKMREVIQSGMIGNPVVWRSVSGGSGAPTPWFFDAKIGGGPFIDGAVHNYDWARFTFGEAVSVSADLRTMKADTTAWDTGTAVINFESSDQLIMCWSWGLPGFGSTVRADAAHDVLGPLGCIMLPGDGKLLVRTETGEEEVTFEPDTGADWFRRQMAHFVECVREGKQPMVGAAEGIGATRIAEAILNIGDKPAVVTL